MLQILALGQARMLAEKQLEAADVIMLVSAHLIEEATNRRRVITSERTAHEALAFGD